MKFSISMLVILLSLLVNTNGIEIDANLEDNKNDLYEHSKQIEYLVKSKLNLFKRFDINGPQRGEEIWILYTKKD
jgi:hypothetical protein